MVGYRVAEDAQYLVITGDGIPEMKVVKEAWILPGQFSSVLDISPVKYNFKLEVMSSGNQANLAFLLPIGFTIGPNIDDMDNLLRYAKVITPHYHNKSNYVIELVEEIVEREIRVLAYLITMEEILKCTNEFIEFTQKVFENVQFELDTLGLFIYNVNIDQLVQIPAQESQNANKQVKSEVDRQQKLAEAMLYEKEKAAEAQRIAAEADLFVKQEEVEGEFFARQKRAEWELFAKQKKAESELFARQKRAESELFAKQKKKEWELLARQKKAEGELLAEQMKAEGKLLAEQMKVEGSIVLADAQRSYLKTLLDAFGGNNIAMRDYLVTKNGVYQDMAKINVGAVVDLKPNVSVLTDGKQTLEVSREGSNSVMKEIAGVC